MVEEPSAARGPTTTRALRGIELEHKQRLVIAGQAQALALADGEMDDAVMAAQHRARLVHDLAGPRRIGPQAVRRWWCSGLRGTKQMSWLSGLSAVTSPSSAAMARTSLFSMSPSGKRR